jgi:transposase
MVDAEGRTRGGEDNNRPRRETGHDRKTVRKYIRSGEPPGYTPREPKASLLDPFKDYIKVRVAQYNLRASRILREIKKKGYEGEYTILKEYIRPLRTEQPIEAVYRYETKPGIQGQVDFDPIGYIETDGLLKRLYCFNMILSFSRNRFTQFTADARTEEFLRLLLEAGQYFDGFPKEILFDNLKQVVLKRSVRYEDNEWNPSFEDFFGHYDITPRLCRPGRAQTKGKVENQVKLVQHDFYNGLDYSGLADLNGKALVWCNEVNARVHLTTGAIPRDKLKEEGLPSISEKPIYQIVRIIYRKISRDCFVSVDGNRYSVPWKHAGQHARILAKNGVMTVEISGEKACQHELKAGTGGTIRVKEHFEGLLAEIRGQSLRKHVLRTMKLPGVPDVERRPLSVYDMASTRGGIDG